MKDIHYTSKAWRLISAHKRTKRRGVSPQAWGVRPDRHVPLMKPPFLFFSVHPPFGCQRFVLNVNKLARPNNKSMLTLTLAPFVPIMLLPSAEDLCIFDIKFLLSSRLLSCWLFLTRRPRSPNFPIFNAERAHPRLQTPFAPPQLNSVGLLLLACAVCTVLELQCAALSPSCTLKPTLNNVPL